MHAVVLASASPRRRILLEELEIPFDVDPSNFEEVIDPNTPARKLVSDLAYAKAAEVQARRPNDIVIGADTIVVFEGEYLGKPAGEQSAIAQLRKMSGRSTSIFTGLAVLGPNHKSQSVVEVPATIKTFTDAELIAYIESGIYKDKAGGVSIEIVEHCDDAIDAVLGLPLGEVVKALRANGIAISTSRY